MTRRPTIPRAMSGDDLRAAMQRHSITTDAMPALAGFSRSTLFTHLAHGGDPLPLRVSNAYRGVFAWIDSRPE